jgi:hypothetical protein
MDFGRVRDGSTEDDLRFLLELGEASVEVLRKRRLPRGGAPLRLPTDGAR